jgi:hypothetical protein
MCLRTRRQRKEANGLDEGVCDHGGWGMTLMATT